MKISPRPGSALAARVCLCIGLLGSGLLALRLRHDDDVRIRKEFAHEIREYASIIDRQFSENVAILYSIKGLFDSSASVTRSEFRTFTSSLLSRYPSMRAVGWVPRIPSGDRLNAEARAVSDGLAGFRITESTEQGKLISAEERDEYYPVYYIEPWAGNEEALAFDLASNRIRREALYAARDTGQARASGRITLVQETVDEWAVLIFVPVYDGAPKSVAERQAAIRGVVSGVFRLCDLLATAGIPGEVTDTIHMQLFEETSDGRVELMHDARLPDDELSPAYRHETPLIAAAGRQWTLVATPSADYISGRKTTDPYVSFLVGILATGWLSYYLSRLTREKRNVERQVGEQTRVLRAQSGSLAKSNETLRQEVRERRLLQQRIAEVTDHEQRRLGHELHDSLGQQIAMVAMLARSLQKRLTTEDGPDARLLESLVSGARAAQAQVRALSKGLLPMEVEGGGLRVALEQLTASTKWLCDVDVQFHCEDGIVVDNVAATHLYRIAQEALRNSLEHSRASHITISLSSGDRGVTLAIRDDGRGLPASASSSPGAGLSSMRHRAELIGATVDIESSENEGTAVICFLPQAPPTR